MVNCNPETVSTDYDTSDRLYFEPLTLEDVSRSRRRRHARGPVGASSCSSAGRPRSARAGARGRRRADRRHDRRRRSTSPRTAAASAAVLASSGSRMPATARPVADEARRSPTRSATRCSCGRPTCSAAAAWRSSTTTRCSRLPTSRRPTAASRAPGARRPLPRRRDRDRRRRGLRRRRALPRRGHGAHRGGRHPLRRLGVRAAADHPRARAEIEIRESPRRSRRGRRRARAAQRAVRARRTTSSTCSRPTRAPRAPCRSCRRRPGAARQGGRPGDGGRDLAELRAEGLLPADGDGGDAAARRPTSRSRRRCCRSTASRVDTCSARRCARPARSWASTRLRHGLRQVAGRDRGLRRAADQGARCSCRSPTATSARCLPGQAAGRPRLRDPRDRGHRRGAAPQRRHGDVVRKHSTAGARGRAHDRRPASSPARSTSSSTPRTAWGARASTATRSGPRRSGAEPAPRARSRARCSGCAGSAPTTPDPRRARHRRADPARPLRGPRRRRTDSLEHAAAPRVLDPPGAGARGLRRHVEIVFAARQGHRVAGPAPPARPGRRRRPARPALPLPARAGVVRPRRRRLRSAPLFCSPSAARTWLPGRRRARRRDRGPAVRRARRQAHRGHAHRSPPTTARLGSAGRVTDVLPGVLERTDADVVYACGPMGMLRAVAEVARPARRLLQCAVEEAMACGIGVCMTCVLPVVGDDGVTRMLRSCVEGPVFRGDRCAGTTSAPCRPTPRRARRRPLMTRAVITHGPPARRPRQPLPDVDMTHRPRRVELPNPCSPPPGAPPPAASSTSSSTSPRSAPSSPSRSCSTRAGPGHPAHGRDAQRDAQLDRPAGPGHRRLPRPRPGLAARPRRARRRLDRRGLGRRVRRLAPSCGTSRTSTAIEVNISCPNVEDRGQVFACDPARRPRSSPPCAQHRARHAGAGQALAGRHRHRRDRARRASTPAPTGCR
jgi:hypothetical protein